MATTTTPAPGDALAIAAALHRVPVRVSGTLSCGCSFRPSEPIPAVQAASTAGRVLICDTHDEWAVTTRVTTHLVATAPVLRALFTAEGLDDTTVDYLTSLYATD